MAESPSKRHKKHKKHKHKKGRTEEVRLRGEEEGEEEDVDVGLDYETPGGEGVEGADVDVGSPPIKLKIKLGRETVGTPPSPGKDPEGAQWQDSVVRGGVDDDVFLTKKAGDDTSDEEREWLDALEAGTLDDNGTVKRCSDPKLMTARQRARVSGTPEEPMMQLPSGYKTTELTEEQLVRRQQRAKKRRELAFEKQEKDKKQTVDRLLKKQQTKFKGGKSKGPSGGSRKTQIPAFRYSSNLAHNTLSVPSGYQFPMEAQLPKQPPAATLCGVSGCHNTKKYSCSQTGTPLCSLQCYKANLATQRPGMVQAT